MLEYQIDNLEGVDATLHPLYEEVDGKFRLKVKGIDTGEELKNALKKERDSNKDARQKLADLEKQREEAEKKVLAEQGKYKDLSEKERQEKLEAQQKLNDLTRKVAERQGAIMVRDLASSLTSDDIELKIIQKFASDYLEFDNDDAKWSKSEDEIKTELSAFVRSKAKGSNDSGGKGGGNAQTINRVQFDGLDANAKMKFVKDGGQVKE